MALVAPARWLFLGAWRVLPALCDEESSATFSEHDPTLGRDP